MKQFNELGLSDQALEAVARLGYEAPTPVQEQAIPLALEGRDLIAAANVQRTPTRSNTCHAERPVTPAATSTIHEMACGSARTRKPNPRIATTPAPPATRTGPMATSHSGEVRGKGGWVSAKANLS